MEQAYCDVNKNNYILSDEDWNLENVNKMIAKLDQDLGENPSDMWKYEVVEILEDLCLNRSDNGSRFPEWFSEMKYPERFNELIDNIFGDFEIEF